MINKEKKENLKKKMKGKFFIFLDLKMNQIELEKESILLCL